MDGEHQFIRQVNCYFNVKDKMNMMIEGSIREKKRVLMEMK